MQQDPLLGRGPACHVPAVEAQVGHTHPSRRRGSSSVTGDINLPFLVSDQAVIDDLA